MNKQGKATIRKLPTGVPGLDSVLGGGLPEYSFNLIAGDPGAGKTTLCHQIMFANATAERPALFFTIVGEPPLKMLRYQQQFSFFDIAMIDRAVHFVNLTEQATNDLGGTLETIEREVQRLSPAFVIVDSFRSLMRRISQPGSMDLDTFLHRLSVRLASWEATTFLVGEYTSDEAQEHPTFTVADGIVWLSQNVNRNSMVRKLQVMKQRGQEVLPGLHTFRITDHGLRVFPRTIKPFERAGTHPPQLISSGIDGIDELLGGGILQGSAVLVAGPSGSGKSTVGLQFLADGVKHQEHGVLAMFEESTEKYIEQAKSIGIDLGEMAKAGAIKLIYLRPLDLSIDETLHEIQDGVAQVGAQRVVIDSLTGLEIALAPTFEQDFRESLYRLVGALTGSGVTVMMTVEVADSYTELRFSPHAVSFMTNDIILQRYIELEGCLRTVVTIVKTRSRKHSNQIREYQITNRGIVVGRDLSEYIGIITGTPRLRDRRAEQRE
ncbi:MAG TPA: ATPase domain-containing protein [Vicinamibacterales bacterium]|nr:ATPase domain-containing protein [Vicinamibacterales bacterium]